MQKKMVRNIIIGAAVLLVAVGAILFIILFPFGSGSGSTADEYKIDNGTDLVLSVNSDGLHCAQVQTNSKGEIENNSFGTLIDYPTADIKKLSIESESANFTFLLNTPTSAEGKSQATVYTLEGFEDYALEQTNPSLMASAAASVSFKKVADLTGDNAADYGLDKPKVTATTTFVDGTYSVLRIGGNSAADAYTYVQFGDSKTVYVVAKADVEALLYDISELFSTSLYGDATSVSDDSFTKITLGGTHLDSEVTIEHNTEGSLAGYYVMSSHSDAVVNVSTGSSITGALKALHTDGVVSINPDSEKLQALGLKDPYATVKAHYEYTDTDDAAGDNGKSLDVSMSASKPDSDGNVNIMETGGKLVYKIAASSVPWVTADFDDLKSEYVLNPTYSKLKAVTLTDSGKTYRYELSSKDTVTTDADGKETTQTVTEITLNGKTVNSDSFYILYQDLALLTNAGSATAGESDGTKLLTVTYEYTTNRAKDTVVFYSTGTQKVLPEVNGSVTSYVYKNYVTALANNAAALSQGKEISSIA